MKGREWWVSSKWGTRAHLVVGHGNDTACGQVLHLDARQDHQIERCIRCLRAAGDTGGAPKEDAK